MKDWVLEVVQINIDYGLIQLICRMEVMLPQKTTHTRKAP